MSKKKKSHNPAAPAKINGYKQFIIDIAHTLNKYDLRGPSPMSSHFKRMMWEYKMVLRSPIAANDCVSVKELKFIAQKIKQYFHEPTQKIGDKKMSSYEFLLLNCYTTIRAKELAKIHGDKEHPEVKAMEKCGSDFFSHFSAKYLLDYFRIITQLNNPDKKYYGVHIRTAHIFDEKPTLELVTKIYGIHAIKCMMKVNDIRRPAFRLAKADANAPITWISVKVELINDLYKGDKKELDVYIQSHALTRLQERLDLLSREGVNYVLWENTHTIKAFETYKGYLFLPIKVFGVKIGYLLASIIEEKLLFRTFLFITHNSTPEGDRLRKLSGLGKRDISYWHIDRLSTFVNLDENEYPGLSKLFSNAGLGDLAQLKDKEFDIDALQTANLKGLTDYINRGLQSQQNQDYELV